MGKARKISPNNKTLAVRIDEHNIVVMTDAVVGRR